MKRLLLMKSLYVYLETSKEYQNWRRVCSKSCEVASKKKLEVNFESICNNVIDMLYGYIIYPEFTSNDIVDDQLYQQLRATNIKFNLKMEQVTYAGYDYQFLRSLPKQQYFNLQNIFQKIVDKIKADLPEKKMCIRVLDKIKELIIKANNNMG